MKFREPKGVIQEAFSLAFFASCLDEASYEYTAATYKPRVMSGRSLAIEACYIIAGIEDGVIDRARLYPVLDELRDRLTNDKVAKRLLVFPVEYYVSYTKNDSIKDIRTRLGLLRSALGQGRYRDALEDRIVDLCGSGQHKREIRESARNWITSVLGDGFSREFVRDKVSLEFFSGDAKYREPSDLKEFFSLFRAGDADFEAVFAVSDVISELTEVLPRVEMEALTRDEATAPLAARLEANDERLVLVRNIRARDVYSARDAAERLLEHLSDLFAIFHHKSRISWKSKVVVRGKENFDQLVLPSTSSIARSRDNVPKKASQKLSRQIGGLKFSDGESAGRFVSVVRLHGSAQQAASPQAQLVNLWTAMEVLVSRESESKLRAVKRCIIPFLAYGYFDRILFGLTGDLYRWDRKRTSRILKKVGSSGWSRHQKLAVVLLGGELETLRDELYNVVSGYPLLMNRCYEVSKLISCGGELLRAINSHEKRIAWQIERIYRARNAIVHDGNAPRWIDALAENAHEYLDAFIDRFLFLTSQISVVSTLDEAIAHQTKLYEDWKKLLSVHKAKSVHADSLFELCALDRHRARSSVG
jgi:hypothetical protein